MDKKVIVGGSCLVVAAGAIIFGLSHQEAPVIDPAIKVVCTSKEITKEYDTLSGPLEKKGASTKMLSPKGQPFYFDGDCVKK